MSTRPSSADTLHHHSRRMGGRDRRETHRVATPLELLFDLTFVVSFGLAASQLAHALAERHYGTRRHRVPSYSPRVVRDALRD